MATQYGTKLTYSAKPNSTEGIQAVEFWGKAHVQDAMAHLKKQCEKPATLYHVFEVITKEIA